MRKIFYIVLFLLMISYLFSFGKNKVQYHKFDWKVLETNHFKIYYYDGGEMLADFCAEVAETSLKHLQRDLLYKPKSKVHILVYNSHNHFEETNVMGGIPEESVGGFTEFFKNRVVVPYEGNWEDFRHVIHHELTHALMNQMLFKGNFQAIMNGLQQMNMPLWFIEGIAEYESRGGWDANSDMTIRDAVYNGYLQSIYYLNNYMAYKGGQSLFKYIADTYGSKKIGQILRNVNMIRSAEGAFKDAIGLEFKDLSEDWQKWLKAKYWATLTKCDMPQDVSVRLSDHIKYGNAINNSPSISPDGLKVAFLSNKSDYFDIYLMRTFDGEIINKIVSGQSSGDFEEFHWLRPGIAWSPDSKNIAFFSKSTDQDALFIYEAETGKKLDRIKFDMDGLYYPDWSVDGSKICFTGIKNGFSDIYLYDIYSKELTRLTNDIYSDNDPKFSPDGKKIVFSSDRLDDLTTNLDNITQLLTRNLNTKDIYTIDISNKELTKVSDSDFRSLSPFWISDNMLGYISDKSGVNNIYSYDLSSKNEKPLTNFMTGCSDASYNHNKLAYTAVFNGGYDIYLIEEVDKLTQTEKIPEELRWYEETDFSKPLISTDSIPEFSKTNLRKFQFSKNMLLDIKDDENTEDTYLKKQYEPFFTPDIITVNAGYATGYGVVGSAYLQFSDYLSSHRLIFITDMNQDLLNSTVDLYYFYLPARINWGIGFSHDVVYYYIWDEIVDEIGDRYRDRLLTFNFMSEYPLSRYSRFDSFLSLKNIINEEYNEVADEYEHDHSNTLMSIGTGFSYDSAIWGYVGPVNGSRFRASLYYTTDMSDLSATDDNKTQFQTFTMDYRKYFRLKGDYQFAFRFTGGISGGNTPQQFYLGGLSNWFNYRINSDHDFTTVNAKYFSYTEYPVRGYRLYEQVGNTFALFNLEYRYPMIKYLALGFPFPMVLGNIMGVMFTDVGAAWNDDDFRGVKSIGTDVKLNDIMLSSGIGARMNVGYFILRYDVSWKWDLYNESSKPQHLISLGTNF
ncbi:MAG: peptidase MA family metallohydrolase [Candidatus Delongbacteria bacterium]|jgi:Tol biopolymer transport system component|nr:peptidase MA family metallohydrolase [Candidatus Delongbacteria bacterium]